jgi:hypothetical protein
MTQSYQKAIQISKKKACKAARKCNRIRIKADEAILLCKAYSTGYFTGNIVPSQTHEKSESL